MAVGAVPAGLRRAPSSTGGERGIKMHVGLAGPVLLPATSSDLSSFISSSSLVARQGGRTGGFDADGGRWLTCFDHQTTPSRTHDHLNLRCPGLGITIAPYSSATTTLSTPPEPKCTVMHCHPMIRRKVIVLSSRWEIYTELESRSRRLSNS